MAIECKLPAEILKPGSVTLPAKKLDEIVNKAPGVEINLTIDKNQLTKITSDRSKFQINGVSSDEFPKMVNSLKKEEQFSVNQEDFLRAISLTSFAASRFETTSILSGVNLEVDGKQFEIGATDGSRLARYISNLQGTPKKSQGELVKKSLVIPGRALVELERLITSFKEGNDTVYFYLMPGQIIFQNNDFTLSTRLIDGTFPTYDKLIPKDQPYKVIFSRTSLLSSLERVAVLANERTNVVKLTFKKGSNTVKLTSNSPDYGDATDEVDLEYSGEDMEIAFNYRYLSEVLRNLEPETLTLELEGPLSPLVLKTHDKVDYNYTYLIMPVQLRS